MDTITNRNYNPMLITNYIIEYCKTNDIKINNLKLQKILYYIQARSLVENNASFFSEKLEKWKYGPALPSVYHEYKSYGAYNIKDKKTIIRLARKDETPTLLGKFITEDYNPDNITDSDKHIINDTLNRLKDYEPFELVDLTQKHSIWSDYEDKILNPSAFRDFESVYEDKEIKNFFDNNPEEQLWKKSTTFLEL